MKKLLTILFLLPGLIAASQEPELVLPTGHTGSVWYARFSSDNKYLLTSGEDKTLNIWETLTGKKIKTLHIPGPRVRDAYFSKDTRYIYAYTDSVLRVWTVNSYSLKKEIPNVLFFLPSPGNQFIYFITLDHKLNRINLENGEAFSFPGTFTRLGDIHKSGRHLAVMKQDTLLVINTDNNRIIRERIFSDLQLARFIPQENSLAIVAGYSMFKYQFISDISEKLGKAGSIGYLSENKRYLYVTDLGEGNEGKLWDLHEMKMLFTIDTMYSIYDTLAVSDEEGNTKYVNGSSPIPSPGVGTSFFSVWVANDGKQFASYSGLWNMGDYRKSYELPYQLVRYGSFSADMQYVVVRVNENDPALWDVARKRIVQVYNRKAEKITYADSSPKENIIVVVSGKIAKLVSLETGKVLHILNGHKQDLGSALFSPDGTQVLTNSFDSTACLWDVSTGKLLKRYKKQHYETNPAYFRWNGEIVLPELADEMVEIVDPVTNEIKTIIVPVLLKNPGNYKLAQGPTGKHSIFVTKIGMQLIANSGLRLEYDFTVSTISPDESLLAIAKSGTDSFYLAHPSTGEWLYHGSLGAGTTEYGVNAIINLEITKGNKYLVAVSEDHDAYIFDLKNDYRLVKVLPGEFCKVTQISNHLVLINGGKLDVYDLDDLQLLYTYVAMGEENYLVVDGQKRYDGTEAARKLLYYTCGNEIVDLEQFKDKLWVPGLAQRIFTSDSIYTPGIQNLNICGYTPVVEPGKNTGTSMQYHIRPRSGGLGETAVYINGIEVKRYKPEELTRTDVGYTLELALSQLHAFYSSGNENTVLIRAFTSDNSISSRGLSIRDTSNNIKQDLPNLYAVMVGISDYKGDQLDLKFAAKDASDLSKAIAASARKFFNTDGKEHVFIYEMTTNEERYRLPEKLAIKKTLEEIGEKATPNDILFVFFAGHGVMQGEKKQFYFLTAEASTVTSDADYADAGISTAELTEWIKPTNLKAQKRILIFDACNSGQAISDIVKIGKDDQGYMAARNDEKGQQVKLLEKLNERSGFNILSASASDQSAYEMGRYAQGILTYALLKTMKEKPDILENGKYLDLSRWFNASASAVELIVAQNGGRQEPKFTSTANFIIGIVDQQVLSSIKLPVEKPVFSSSILLNANTHTDNLKLSRLLNAELAAITNDPQGRIIYMPDADAGSYSLTGNYTITGKQVSLRLSLNQDEKTRNNFTITGDTEKLTELIQKVRTYISERFK